MNTIRPAARTGSAPTSPANSRSDAEDGLLEGWDDDVVRVSRASARKRGLKADHPFAADVAQEVRLALVLSIRRSGITDERYIRRVISNSARNAARQTKVAAREDHGDTLEEILEKPAVRDVLAVRRVQRWICNQPSQHQAVFSLLYCEDLSQREAAVRLGVSQPRVAKLHRQLLERGEDALRDLAA